MTVAGLLTVLAAASSTVAPGRLIDDLVAGKAELPSLAVVQRAAVEALGLPSDEDAAGWAHRARLRGLVPRVDAAIGRNAGLDVRASSQTADALTTTEGQQLALDLSVRFELGELVFSELELRASRESIARAAAIQLARDRVTQLYFERVEVTLEVRERPTVALALSAARLDGLLDALTGGRLRWPKKEKKP